MAENILTKKQNGVSLMDAGVIAVSKPVIEGAYNLIGIGNDNLVSATTKVLLAGASGKMLGKQGGNVATAMLVSAVDDLTTRFLPGLFAGKTAKNVQVVGGSDSNQSANVTDFI